MCVSRRPNYHVMAAYLKEGLLSNRSVHVRQGVGELRFAPRQLHLSFEKVHSRVDLTLLQAELGESGDSSFALRVNLQRFLATTFGSPDILFRLVESKTLVHNREDILSSSKER